MILPLTVSVLWLLCMLAAVAAASARAARRIDLAWLVPAFAIVILLSTWRGFNPSWVGAAAALSAAWLLFAPPPTGICLSLAGALSAMAASLYIGQGANIWIVGAGCLGIVVIAALLARDTRFAASNMRTAMLVLLCLAAPMAAAAPSVASGWQAAQALNQDGLMSADRAVPYWAWQLAAGALCIGMVRGLWARR